MSAPPAWRAWSRRRRWRLVAGAPLAAGSAAVAPFAVLFAVTAGHRYAEVASAPAAPVALVLGAGVDGGGRPTPFLADRVNTAVALYRSGRVRALLMSGDHGRPDYDEVDAMAALARDAGVPEAAIVLDHAGFDTFSSCYRARTVWGLSRVLVVSQAFHLSRAVWLCRRLGVAADGVATPTTYPGETRAGWLREVPAAAKAVIDVVFGRVPQFPGPREHALDPLSG
jgi:vancomycin permeability regulator SanA